MFNTRKYKSTLISCLCIVAIALITFLVYLPALDDGLTNWDDPVNVINNPLVVSKTLQVVKIFETPVTGNYHPITYLSLAINYQLGKLNPFGYHLVNVIFHVLNTILVFMFVFLLTRRNLLMAAIVSLFFGIHPMHVESVAWITGRKDVLYVFFFIAGLITYLKYAETKKIVWYIVTFLFFVLSCLSKGMAVVFPLILLLIDYLQGVKWQKKLLFEKIPFLIVAIALAIVDSSSISVAQNSIGIKNFTIGDRLLFACYGAVMYVIKFFVPYKLSSFYPYPITNDNSSVPFIFYLSPIILLVLLIALIYFFKKKEKEIVFGLLFYFISIVLVLQFTPVSSAVMAERYSYLSYVGLLFIVAYLVNKCWSKLNSEKKDIWYKLKYPLAIILFIGVIIFSYQTYSRTRIWQNSETLWTDVLENYPDAALAYKARADYYYEVHETDKAIDDYTDAVEFDPQYAGAYTNRGIIYSEKSEMELAAADFNKAIALDSTNADTYKNRALLYFKTGKINAAITDCNIAIALSPASAIYYYNRAMIYSSQPDKKEIAVNDFMKAIQLDSTYSDAYNNLGLLYLNLGKTSMALNNFTKAIVSDSTNASAYSNRAFLYFSNGENALALMDCNKAIVHDPTSAIYYNNRALVEDKLGNKEAAATDAFKAQQLQGK